MKMSRITAALLAAVTALATVGCGEIDDDMAGAKVGAANTAETPAVTETAEIADAAEDEKPLAAEEKIRQLGEAEKPEGDLMTVSYKPSYEEAVQLAELAVKQCNAVLGRDGAAYCETLNIKKLCEGEDFPAVLDEIIKNGAGDSAKLNVISWYSEPLIDNVVMKHSEVFDDPEDRANDEAFEKYLAEVNRLLTVSIGEVDADTFRDGLKDDYSLESSFFTQRYLAEMMDQMPEAGIKPIEGRLTYDVMLKESAEENGGKYMQFELSAYSGSEEKPLMKCLVVGFIKGGEAGVYTDSYAITSFEEWSDRQIDEYDEEESGEDDGLTEEQKAVLAGLAVKQYNAIVSRDAEEYLKTLNITGLFGSEDTAAEEEKQQSEARDTLGKCVRNAYMTPLRDKQKLDGGSFPENVSVIDKAFLEQAVKAGKNKGDIMTNYVNELFFLNGEDGRCRYTPFTEAAETELTVRSSEKVDDVVYVDFYVICREKEAEVVLWHCVAWLRGDEAGVYADMIDRTELEPYEYEQDDDSEQ